MTNYEPWTTAMDRYLLELLEDPILSYKNVANMISARFERSITKNACIGRARRLGVPMRDQTLRPSPKDKTIKVKRVRVDAPIAPRIPYRLKNGHLTIYQLREDTCRWPLGGMLERPPFMYCGEAAPIGCPYCAYHAQVARGGVRVSA